MPEDRWERRERCLFLNCISVVNLLLTFLYWLYSIQLLWPQRYLLKAVTLVPYSRACFLWHSRIMVEEVIKQMWIWCIIVKWALYIHWSCDRKETSHILSRCMRDPARPQLYLSLWFCITFLHLTSCPIWTYSIPWWTVQYGETRREEPGQIVITFYELPCSWFGNNTILILDHRDHLWKAHGLDRRAQPP